MAPFRKCSSQVRRLQMSGSCVAKFNRACARDQRPCRHTEHILQVPSSLVATDLEPTPSAAPPGLELSCLESAGARTRRGVSDCRALSGRFIAFLQGTILPPLAPGPVSRGRRSSNSGQKIIVFERCESLLWNVFVHSKTATTNILL